MIEINACSAAYRRGCLWSVIQVTLVMNAFFAKYFAVGCALAALLASGHVHAAAMSFGAAVQVGVLWPACFPGGPPANNEFCGFSIGPSLAQASRSTSQAMECCRLMLEPATAQATANLSAGFVSVAASSSGTTLSTLDYAYAHALIWDTLTFSGIPGGATQITLHMSGTWGGSGDARVSAFSALVLRSAIVEPAENLGSYLDFFFVAHDFSDGVSIAVNGCCTPTPEFSAGTYSFEKSWPIYNDVPMVLFLSVSAYSGGGGRNGLDGSQPGNAFITDPLTFDLPEGVSFTAASAIAAPEPSSVLLLVSGIAGLAAWRRRNATATRYLA